jgi:hypothetical protein
LLRRLKQLKFDYETVFNTPEGKRVLADLARRHGVFETVFVQNDPYHTSFREGKRAVIVDLLRYLNVSVAEFQKLERLNDRTDDE